MGTYMGGQPEWRVTFPLPTTMEITLYYEHCSILIGKELLSRILYAARFIFDLIQKLLFTDP